MVTMRSDFPGGNGRLVSAEHTECGRRVAFLAETKYREPQPNWFYFRLDGLAGARTRLVIANAVQCLDDFGALGWANNHPVYREASGAWQRVKRVHCDMNDAHCLEVWFDVPTLSESMEFAFCYPYQKAQLDATLSAHPALRHTVIGYSGMGRPIERAFIDSSAQNPKGVYVLGRQHAGEVGGGWVIDGMLRHLAVETACDATKNAWWFVPIVDVDGVEEGCYGKDQVWGDFNRSWGAPFPNRTELHAIEHDIDHWMRAAQGALILDVHSPGNDIRGLHFIVPGDMPRAMAARIEDITAAFNEQLSACGYEPCSISRPDAGTNTSAKTGMSSVRYANAALGIAAATLEVSYQGPTAGGFYTLDDYHGMGACLARAIEASI